MNPKTLQYLMGHSDIGVTLNVYTHLGYEDAKEELSRICLGIFDEIFHPAAPLELVVHINCPACQVNISKGKLQFHPLYQGSAEACIPDGCG